jgi:hypothetical protein
MTPLRPGYDLAKAVDELVSRGVLFRELSTYAIAKDVARNGYDHLSPVRKMVFDVVVRPKLEELFEEKGTASPKSN